MPELTYCSVEVGSCFHPCGFASDVWFSFLVASKEPLMMAIHQLLCCMLLSAGWSVGFGLLLLRANWDSCNSQGM